MDIYNNLPPELQNKIKYYAIEHPCAVMIKDKMLELRCNLYFVFKDSKINQLIKYSVVLMDAISSSMNILRQS